MTQNHSQIYQIQKQTTKQTSTPTTAQSTTTRSQLTSISQINFSSSKNDQNLVIEKVSHNFLSQNPQSFGNKQIQQMKRIKMKQSIMNEDKKQKQIIKQSDYNIIIKNITNRQNFNELKKTQNQWKYLVKQKKDVFHFNQLIQKLQKQQLILGNNRKLIKQFYANIQNPESQKIIIINLNNQKQNLFMENGQISVVVILELNGFEREICRMNFQEKQKQLDRYSFDSSSLAILCKNSQNQLTIIIPHTQIQKIKHLRHSLLNKSPQLNQITTISHLKGLLFQLCQQNMGSRIIQKLIHLNKLQSIKILKQQLKQKYEILMANNYGNYVIQKMFCYFNEEEKINFLMKIQKNVKEIAKSKFGMFCLQFIVNKCYNRINCLAVIQQSIQDHIKQLCFDQFGVHFIKQCILNSCTGLFVNYFLSENKFIPISQDRYGILAIKCFIQKYLMIECNFVMRHQILYRISQIMITIFSDQYSHFLMEDLLNYYSELQLNGVLKNIIQNFEHYSCNQYSANFIYLTLQRFSYVWISTVLNHLLENQLLIPILMNSKSGSFILHKLINIVPVQQRQSLLNVIRKQCNKIKQSQKIKSWNRYWV